MAGIEEDFPVGLRSGRNPRLFGSVDNFSLALYQTFTFLSLPFQRGGLRGDVLSVADSIRLRSSALPISHGGKETEKNRFAAKGSHGARTRTAATAV